VFSILLLSETTLADHDAARIVDLHGTEDVVIHLLVPADAAHNRLIEALDDVTLGRLRDALDDDTPTPEQAEQDAMHAVNASLDKLRAVGITSTQGSVTGSDPVPAAIEAVRQDGSDEVIVVTPPHPVESGLHRDWASRLRDELELPVLHVVSGTDRVVS
jgi:hypothetical protein